MSYIWNHSDHYMIPYIDACVNGWRSDGKSLYPIWFVGDQYPPIKKRTKPNQRDGYAADEDVSAKYPSAQKKRGKRKVFHGPGQKFRKFVKEDNQEYTKASIQPGKTLETIIHDSDNDGEDEMGATVDEVESPNNSDEWERLSEFDDDSNSDSSDSDWI